MSDLCKCGHDATAHSFGHGDCGWTGGSRTALCPCMQFTRDDRGRPAGKSQGAASAGEPPEVSDALTAPADRDDLAAIGRQIVADYALDHESLHANWRCEHPDVYGPCGCVDEFLTSFASMVLQSDWLRGVRAKELRDAADEATCDQDPPCGMEYCAEANEITAQWLRDRADRVQDTRM